MASEKVELTKKVDELSTKLLEFAENLTKFSQITNEKYKNFNKVRDRTNKNSETIFTLIDMLKGHGLKLRDVESELTDINETVDERFEKVSEKLKTLSKNYKQILKVVTGNSGNIERLFNKIKGKGRESGGGGEVREVSLVQSESEFKEDEEPTARMMELVSSFSVYNTREFLGISSSGEIIFKELFKSQPEGRGPYPGSMIPAYSTAAISFYNREGEFVRQIAGDTTINPYSQSTIPFDGHRGMFLLDNGYLNLKIIDDQIYIQVSWHRGTADSAQYGYQVFSMTGEFIRYIDDRKRDLIVTNRGIINKTVLDLINKYDSNLDYIIRNNYSSKFIITKNGEIYIIRSEAEYNKQITVFDSEGNFIRKFLLSKNYSNLACSLGSDDNYNIEIFENELFITIKSNIYVYNLSGEFQYKFNYGVEFTKESIFISDKRPDRTLINFKVTNSGDFCIVFRNHNQPSMGIKIYKRGYSYVQRPLERKYKIYTNYQVQKDLESLEAEKVLSVKFPLCVYQYKSPFPTIDGSIHHNLLTHTIYFQKPQSVKKAVQAVEEYFNGSVTKSDFQDLQSGCLFGYIEGRFASRELNWETCNYNRLCRGYFLGGNVLSGIRIRDQTELVLDITQD
jgi:hypothetical protein